MSDESAVESMAQIAAVKSRALANSPPLPVARTADATDANTPADGAGRQFLLASIS